MRYATVNSRQFMSIRVTHVASTHTSLGFLQTVSIPMTSGAVTLNMRAKRFKPKHNRASEDAI